MSKAPIESSQRWRSLAEINRAIVGSLDYEEVLQEVVARTTEFTDADHCLLIMSDDGEDVTIAASLGEIPQGEKLADVPLDENIDRPIRRILGYTPEDSLVAVPVLRMGKVKGILAVGRRRTECPDTEQKQLLSALADLAGVALDHADRYAESQRGLRAHRLLTQQIFAHGSMGMCILSPGLMILEVNDAAAAMFDARRSALLGETLESVSAPLAEDLLLPCRTALNGQTVELYAIACPSRSDSTREQFVDISLIPMPGEAGIYHGVMLLAKDVTERQQRERQQTVYMQDLEHSIEEKDRFFNVLSHELRGPLAAVSNATALLGMGEVDDEQKQRAQSIIERNVRYQARLVDDLLDFSRLARGKLHFDMTAVDMRVIVAQQVYEAQNAASAKKLKLSHQVDEQPLVVHGDPLRLSQVIGNLVSNALRYTEEDGRIMISDHAEGHWAVVRVADTGIGLSVEQIQGLFEPFKNAESDAGGLGLGLSIAHSLVEHQQGTLSASSDGPGRGAEFVVRLPLLKEAAADMGTEAMQAEEDEGPLAQRRVMIVEDDADVRNSLADLLRLMGQRVYPVATGEAALNTAIERKPQLCFIDLDLQGDMNGYDIMRALKARDDMDDLHAVALSGYASSWYVDNALASGFDEHVAKPISFDKLRALLS